MRYPALDATQPRGETRSRPWPALAGLGRLALLALGAAACLAWSAPRAAASTLVGFNFNNLGTVYVDLWDDLTPLSVANFLNYVNASAYSNTVIHRSTSLASAGIGIIQGGGFRYNDATKSFSGLASSITVNNEYARANTRGTIAMARLQDINSASSQWFFNTTDNSTALGPQNTTFGPFTTFGWVVGPGMSVIDAINGLAAPAYTRAISVAPRFTTTATSRTCRSTPPTRRPITTI